METAITVLIILSVVLFGALTIAHGYLSSQYVISGSWWEMMERLGERARTSISLGATSATTTTVTAILTNDGDTKLADFGQWDVILQYDGTDDQEHIEWCHYASGPGCQWTKNISEVFEPEILNPDEEMEITIVPTTEITPTGRVEATIATPNGIRTTKGFTR